MEKPLIVFGANGQVGRRLTQAATARGMDVHSSDRETVDITSEASLAAALPDSGFVVNCAAYTAVDKAETERELSHTLNADAPGMIARLCAERGLPFLHISTDYVFQGSNTRPWREDDPIAPLNEYGRGKADGEAQVRAALPRHFIMRTSWVYDSQGANFVRTMLRLGAEREELRVVGDQHGGPTSAEDIALAILAMIDAAQKPGFDRWGTYHFSGGPATTWADFATAIFQGAPKPKVTAITTAEYPTPAKRPAYSVMDCSKIKTAFGIVQPDWRQSLRRVLDEISADRSA
jgi:dTDP-4-dehydrorhamnose reductase